MIGGVGRGPGHNHLPVHRQSRPEEAEAAAGSQSPTVAAAGERTERTGSDTPFTHALDRGEGRKTGIHRRFAEEIAAQQAEAGLGGDVDDAAPVDGPSGDVAPPADDLTPVGDVGSGDEPENEQPAPPEQGPDGGGTIDIDGSGFGASTPPPAETDADLLDEMRELLASDDEGAVYGQPVEPRMSETV